MIMMLDPRRVAGVTLDAGTTTFDTTTEPAATPRNRSAQRLVCRWHRTAEGRLVCVWREVGSNEAGSSRWRIPAESLPPAPSRTQIVMQWIGIALLLAATGVNTVMCFRAEASGLF